MGIHLQGTIPFVIYNTKDSTATHYTEVHNGNEAAAYLQFILDYYDCLPHIMAFIHAHRRDMKVAPDFDMVSIHLVWRVYMLALQDTLSLHNSEHLACMGAFASHVCRSSQGCCGCAQRIRSAVLTCACMLCTVGRI